MDDKIITVLFTRYNTLFAKFVDLISRGDFTHVSLALNEDNEYFYSFNPNGFRNEYPKKHKNRCDKSLALKLRVSQESFNLMQRKIDDMEKQKSKLRLSRWGTFFLLIHIPFKIKNQYTCTQFVAETLKLSDSISLHRNISLYLPNQLLRDLESQDCVKEIVYNPI